MRSIAGVEPVHTYKKSKPAGFYVGLTVIYHPEELGGLSVKKFVEAMRAEQAPITIGGYGVDQLEHLRIIFTRGFDLWGHGRGPLRGEFLGLPSFKVYKKGDFPVAENLVDKVLTLPAYIEPKEGFLEQYIEAFRKVTGNYKFLLPKVDPIVRTQQG